MPFVKNFQERKNMNIAQAMAARRAIKQFDPSKKVSDEHFKEIMTVATQSPSSFNIQHWRFVNVTDGQSRRKIRDAAWDQAQVTDASHLLVLCADVKAWQKNPERYWTDAPDEVSDMIVPKIKDFYDGRDWIQRDEAFRSVGLIAETLMLAAAEKGYDTCPMIGFDQEEVGKIISLPDDHVIGMMIALGVRAKDPFNEPGRLTLDDVVFENKF